MVERREKPINQPRPQGASVPGFVSRPTSKTTEKRPGDEAVHQHFSESIDKEKEIRKHMRKAREKTTLFSYREKRIRETGLFLHLVLIKPRRENSTNSICSFVFFSHLVIKTLGMNVTLFLLFFIQKSRPCVFHTNKKQ